MEDNFNDRVEDFDETEQLRGSYSNKSLTASAKRRRNRDQDDNLTPAQRQQKREQEERMAAQQRAEIEQQLDSSRMRVLEAQQRAEKLEKER